MCMFHLNLWLCSIIWMLILLSVCNHCILIGLNVSETCLFIGVFKNYSSRFVCRFTSHQECVYTKLCSHWVTLCRPTSASHIRFPVILSSSITTLKCANVICNHKDKLAGRRVSTAYTVLIVVQEWKAQACTQNTCERDVSLHFVSQTQAGLGFQALWSPKYISKYTSGCVSLLFTGKWFMGLFGEKK